ncbi:MAG: UDP-N-acetylglucosamine 2-epimerase [Proteobacteria bacterium]|nr:UDP-N-acetylglucosamine 2-epimerase [Pseudomonadota bacterium]MBU1387058.1 UDP-N-acetylglucosamine 2-epimerase [Pseudomonadota bacterium]MBU1541625.1 UDP-N-acetylglucosamine 2-epimerase [Pseudomonadota bacterium]MBU2479491.1 UDP-N-acetylglucosamine 2-epimerase [Pseudomonadota bacterium]
MKNICIIAGSFTDYQILKPLMAEIREDASACLNVIFTEKYHTPQFSILHSHLEQDGFTMEEKSDIALTADGQYSLSYPVIFEQKEYDRLLKLIQPDIVVLSGNAYPTYLAAVYASLNQIPIAHIEGGISDAGTRDHSHEHGIARLSQLHFTSSEKYHRQIIKSGKHPETVFTVGSLLMKNIQKLSLPSRTAFFRSVQLEADSPFLFISFEPDLTDESADEAIIDTILDTVCAKEFSDFKLIFSPQKTTGAGKIISRKIHAFAHANPEQTVILPAKDLTDFGCAIKYCSAMISNFFEGLVIAASFSKPVINIGKDLKDALPNPISCRPDRNALFYWLKKVLRDPFAMESRHISEPFEKIVTARTIKEKIQIFDLTDLPQKEYFQ